jgi:hypothetical protein
MPCVRFTAARSVASTICASKPAERRCPTHLWQHPQVGLAYTVITVLAPSVAVRAQAAARSPTATARMRMQATLRHRVSTSRLGFITRSLPWGDLAAMTAVGFLQPLEVRPQVINLLGSEIAITRHGNELAGYEISGYRVLGETRNFAILDPCLELLPVAHQNGKVSSIPTWDEAGEGTRVRKPTRARRSMT